MVIGDVLRRNARRYPNKTAVVFENTRYTFRELNDRVNSLTNALLDIGVKRGDRVAVLLDNCHQYVEIHWAGAKGGMTVVPLNCGLSRQELAYIVNDAEANTLLLGEKYLEVVNSIRERIKGVRNFIAIGAPSSETMNYEALISSYPSDKPKVEVDEQDLHLLLYTSGTTGLPKGAMLPHRNRLDGTVNTVLAHQLTPQDVFLLSGPIFWGPMLGFVLPLSYVGAALIILKGFDAKTVLETIDRERITTSIMITPHITSLLEYPQLDKYDLRSLRCIVIGGLPLPAEVWKRAIGVFGNIFAQSYGLVEAGTLTFLSPEEVMLEGPPDKMRRLQSCGKETINVELRIVDSDGNDVPPGQLGEIIARTDGVMKGYWKLPQATAEALRGGYFYTGDLATKDEEGYVYLVGRKKDIITSGGKNIYPTEVEEVLYRHPAISEAAVIGVPDEKLGESVKAVVALKEGKKVTQEEIIGFCQQNLASYAIPRSVEFVGKLPRTASGKILKGVLKERYQ